MLFRFILVGLCIFVVLVCQYVNNIIDFVFVVVLKVMFDSVVQLVYINYEKYKLVNGLIVILYQDKFDLLVYVDMMYYVGFVRELLGKIGFVYFFEYMMFQGLENVVDEQYFKIVMDVGGILNGIINCDCMNYFQIVFVNQLEKVFWLEVD